MTRQHYINIFGIIGVLTVSFAMPLQAQAQKQDPAAIIERTSHKYEEWGGVEVLFSANLRSVKNGLSESFEGAITMKGEKFYLRTPDMTVWFDGSTQWTYIARNQEVNVSSPDGRELRSINPMLILKDARKDYNIKLTGESTSHNARTAYDLTLAPKKKDDIESIEVQIEKASGLPSRLAVNMVNEMRNTVTIKEIKAGSPADELFVFPAQQYPDAEIIDLR
jgi:outer membrane lipoprotein-sorting protein